MLLWQVLLYIAAACVLVVDQLVHKTFNAVETAAVFLIVGLLILPGLAAFHQETKMKTVETKVKAATWMSFAAGLALAILTAVQDNPGVMAPLPKWLQVVLLALVPAVATFLAGWSAQHTARPDLGDSGP